MELVLHVRSDGGRHGGRQHVPRHRALPTSILLKRATALQSALVGLNRQVELLGACTLRHAHHSTPSAHAASSHVMQ